jgi:predicted permease
MFRRSSLQAQARRMSSVIPITLPIFLLILVGYASTRWGLTTKDNIRGIGVFVIRLALPALIFRALSQRALNEILDAKYLTVYALGSLIPFGVVFVFSRFLQKKGTAASAIAALGSSASNSGFIGFPIAAMAIGPSAVVALSLTMIVENILMIPLGLGLAESEARKGDPAHEILFFVFRRLTRNPMVLAIIAGVAASLLSWTPPAPLFKAIDLLANASTAAALFAVGGALAGLSLSGLGLDVGRIVCAKLFLHPLAVVAAMALFPSIDPAFKKAMIIFAASPMASIFPLLAQPYGEERPAAAALLGATFFSFFTLSALLLFL